MGVATTITGPAYRDMAADLRRRILDGTLTPGQRLGSEAELAAAHAVSRSTVREALRILTSEHLLETRRGVNGGAFVQTPSPEKVADSLAVGLGCIAGADGLTVDELLEARLLLEVPAARLAARNSSVLQNRRLLEASEPIEAADRFSRTAGFHVAVLEATGNRLLPLMTRPIFEVLETRFVRREAPRGFWTQVGRDHGLIAGAIIDGDTEAAADGMRTHLESLAETYQRIDRRIAP